MLCCWLFRYACCRAELCRYSTRRATEAVRQGAARWRQEGVIARCEVPSLAAGGTGFTGRGVFVGIAREAMGPSQSFPPKRGRCGTVRYGYGTYVSDNLGRHGGGCVRVRCVCFAWGRFDRRPPKGNPKASLCSLLALWGVASGAVGSGGLGVPDGMGLPGAKGRVGDIDESCLLSPFGSPVHASHPPGVLPCCDRILSHALCLGRLRDHDREGRSMPYHRVCMTGHLPRPTGSVTELSWLPTNPYGWAPHITSPPLAPLPACPAYTFLPCLPRPS